MVFLGQFITIISRPISRIKSSNNSIIYNNLKDNDIKNNDIKNNDIKDNDLKDNIV